MIDDICLAAESAGLSISDFPIFEIKALGPLLELRHIRPEFFLDQSWLIESEYLKLLRMLAIGEKRWYDLEYQLQGYASAKLIESDQIVWLDFVKRAKIAAINSGFSNDYAAKMVAAIGELYSNIVEHSESINTGYIAFHAEKGRFQFVIADAGIGVLDSLKSNPIYKGLTDSGRALELALSEGITRHMEPDRETVFGLFS